MYLMEGGSELTPWYDAPVDGTNSRHGNAIVIKIIHCILGKSIVLYACMDCTT